MHEKFVKYRRLLILAQTFVLICAAQPNLPANSVGEIQFHMDDASFYNKSKIYQEIYLMIYTDQLKLVPRDSSQFTDLSISLSIKKRDGEVVIQDSWITEAEVIIDTTQVGGMVVYDQWSRNFDPGNYLLELEVRDNISGKTGTVRTEINAELKSAPITLSDIEFASEIKQNSGDKSLFDKGNVTVLPNPSRRYGILNPVVYFYFEIYNLSSDTNTAVDINYSIETNDGTSLKSFEGKTINLSGVTSGIPNGINVSAVASGIYDLVVNVINRNSGQVVTARRSFEVIQMDFLKKQPILTNEQAEMFGEIIRLISTNNNYELYSNLNLSAKAKFLVQFWKQNDPYPVTDENELFTRISERFQYANEKFSWAGIEGWKSDRGRILIKYGMPDNIQSFASEGSTSPYEIWEYQARRNYQFVFGDLRGDGRYTLLHSTKEDEIYNPYWKEELNKM